MTDNQPDENGFKLTDTLRQSPRSASDKDVLDLCDIIDRRDAEIERLREVFKKYGWHTEDCDNSVEDCFCGFDEVK